ncbi:MAG: hypothetical protein JKY54_00665 [Flavobacteriales bacterium]|nr:hypothetical protein [Flavobacteriales bacterium]
MRLIGIISAVLIFCSCAISNNSKYKDIGSNYEAEYVYLQNQKVIVYRSTLKNRKLNGNIIRRTEGLYDSTIEFKYASTFNKGLLTGKDSLFRNGELTSVHNYKEGLKHSTQLEYFDSKKIISNYENGVIHGEHLTYVNGEISKKTMFNNGVKNGQETTYDSLKNVIEIIEYNFDTAGSGIKHLSNQQIVRLSDTLSLYNFQRKHHLDYRGCIQIFPPFDSWVYHEDAIHNSILETETFDPEHAGYFYIIENWGGDGLDQIWREVWFVYKFFWETKFTYIKVDQ